MATFTFNNPSTCIFQDDLDAINVMYPTCENAVLTHTHTITVTVTSWTPPARRRSCGPSATTPAAHHLNAC